MLNILNAIVAAFFLTAFIGGLASSIWHNPQSLAFMLIVIGVLGAFYVDVYQSIREELNNRNKP